MTFVIGRPLPTELVLVPCHSSSRERVAIDFDGKDRELWRRVPGQVCERSFRGVYGLCRAESFEDQWDDWFGKYDTEKGLAEMSENLNDDEWIKTRLLASTQGILHGFTCRKRPNRQKALRQIVAILAKGNEPVR